MRFRGLCRSPRGIVLKPLVRVSTLNGWSPIRISALCSSEANLMSESNETRNSPATGSFPGEATASAKLPSAIGRYGVVSVLGQGSFGVVYLAQDEQLGRLVAIKVPHTRQIASPEDAAPYLREAR